MVALAERSRRYVIVCILLSALLTEGGAEARPGPAPSASRPGKSAGRPAKAAARGPGAKARALILLTEANKKLRRGFYLEALSLFEKAYRVYPSPKLHFNIAQTHMELGRFLRALHHYEQFVRKIDKEKVSKTLWNLAHARIFQLMGKIATVQVLTNVADAQVAADGRPVGKTPLSEPLRFIPGTHAIVISKRGYKREVIELKLKAGQSVTRRVKLLRPEQAAATRRIVLRVQAEKKRLQQQKREIQRRFELARQRAAQQERRRRRALHIAGWSTLSTGLAVAAVGAVFAILFKSEADKVEKAGTDRYWEDVKKHFDRGNDYKRAAVITLGIGGAIAAAGGVILGFRYGRKEKTDTKPRSGRKPSGSAVSALPSLGPDRIGLTVRVDF